MEAATVVIRNKGPRTYQLANGPDGEKRYLWPEKSLAVSQEEAKQYLNYSDVEDAEKAVPQNAEKIASLQAENAALRAERDSKRAEMKPPAELGQAEIAAPQMAKRRGRPPGKRKADR